MAHKSVLMVIASKDFRDEEYQKPREILEEKNIRVAVASSSKNPARGVKGLMVVPDLLLDQVNPDQFQAVVFVGGGGSREYFRNSRAHALARKTFESGKTVGAICIAPVILANSGILKGRRATVFPSETQSLAAAEAVYTGAEVEKDGSIITANGPDAAESFGRMLLAALEE